MKIDDPQIAARIRARDPGALDAVVSAYLQHILRAARGSGLSAEEAEEVTQATFTTFIEKAHTFEGRSQVRTWLFGILYHKIQEHFRRTNRQKQYDDLEDVAETRFDAQGSWTRPPRALDDRLFDREVREHLSACLEAVPERHRLAFVLREVEDLATEEICKILEVTRTNLGVILMRVRNRLRDCLEGRGVRKAGDAEL